MELRHLRYFVILAEERHFGRAAQRLHMTQPPLSRQIQELERELGFPLFDRTQRRVQLTPAGEVFLERTRGLLDSLELSIREARRASVGETGRLVVGYLASLAYSGITEIIRVFHERFPGVELNLRELGPQAQLDALKERQIDVGLVRGRVEDVSLVSACVRRDPLVVVLPTGHALAGRKRIPLGLLAAEPFVFFPRARSPAFFDQIISLCRGAGFSPRIVQEAPQLDILSLVAAGFGVSIMPGSTRRLARKDIVLRAIVGSPWTELVIVWRADDVSPALREFVAFVPRITNQKGANHFRI